ncbi:MAG TPA: cyclopropane-fatty-acyl-phospholipid synthase family protein [Intrasporangium sp.]|uniref:cyclopropane-fatty-acyl-phospholipid synthase family protein n=1 Tax=Intrasporangium sp. TaxID=1925024 RepID=UPI002D79381C|nr:cyclopropane-fatty-acyl-phospholipid synthase family protein [Intrasporangium sp.]HET7397080.1 cyclopropane-fatty-acyl-phospholipid synthase family protein [Intrasporangium sp.]
MTVAQVLDPLVRATLGDALPVRVDCWDGSACGPADAPLHVRFASRRALRRLLWAPNELGFARAYVSGDVVIEGGLLDALDLLEQVADPARGPGVHVGRDTVTAIVRAVLRLGALGPPPRPPAEEIRLSGRRHTRRRDARAVSSHYDVGNDFYALVLGPSMVYSCAYFEQEPSAAYGLEDAQRAKLDLVARKLGLRPGMRLLDVGCGWGSFVLHAARHHGVRAVGVTVSQEQARLARERVAAAGLADRVEIRLQDYREVTDGPYDAIASIGMAEHVGLAHLPTYAERLHALLAPGGRLLNHAIARRPGPPGHPRGNRTSFIDRYVFPDGELVPLATMVDALETAGLEVRHVESLREHYADTLRAWVANLERDWDRACALSSPGRARVWRLYLAGSALAFAAGRIGVNQVLAVRPRPGGGSGMPRTWHQLLGGGSGPAVSSADATGAHGTLQAPVPPTQE